MMILDDDDDTTFKNIFADDGCAAKHYRDSSPEAWL